MPSISQRALRLYKRATRWRLKGALALAVIAPVIALTAAMAPPAAAFVAPAAQAAPTLAAPEGVPAPPSGWSTVFSDDFNGPAGSGVDSQWMYDTGPGYAFGDGQMETMTNSTSNVYLDGNGDLDITALGSGNWWTSGHIQTTSANVGAPAGGELEVTASIEQPTGGPGYWPAFWLAGPGQWPWSGEIDIMEDVNSLSEVSGTVHCGGGSCDEADVIGSGLTACSGCLSGYHTYTMIFNRTDPSDESITFYVDGTSYFTVTESQIGTWAWQSAFDHNMSIILDLAMGGDYPDGDCACATPNSATTSGGTMSVAYVAAYETTGGGSSSGGSGSATGPITGYDGLCADVRRSDSANYTPVQAHTCNGTDAQQWTVDEAGSTLQALGKCMDVTNGGTADATPVDLYTCNGTGAQVWEPQSNGELYNPQSGKCLDDTDAGGSGTPLDIWDCVDSADQQWNLP